MAVAPRPRVRVLIPVCNGEAFLATAIRSVLRQTYAHFDLTVVNNRHTDRTREIAAHFASADARARIHDNKTFVSVLENRNKAFSLASPHATLKAMGYPIRYPLLTFHVAAPLSDLVLYPKQKPEGLFRRCKREPGPLPGPTAPAACSGGRQEHARALQ